MNITLSFASVISIFTTLVTCNLGKKESLPVVATDTISNQSEKMSIAQMFRENGHLPMEEKVGEIISLFQYSK